ncbi:hypothetical protein HK098_003152 [Nowakowskiella sp. JEL0407]|nr:hypothetical protein HK098_003152 [Nowakowskiella sp. JEL0407]
MRAFRSVGFLLLLLPIIRNVVGVLTVRTVFGNWDNCAPAVVNAEISPQYLLWNLTLSPSLETTEPNCPFAPSSLSSPCGLQNYIPSPSFNNSDLNLTISSASALCSSFNGPYDLPDKTVKPYPLFFPANITGTYLIVSDALVKPKGGMQTEVVGKSDNPLGRLCMSGPGREGFPGGLPPPPPPNGSIPPGDQTRLVSAYLADGLCRPMNSTNLGAANVRYIQARCLPTNFTLNYLCSDNTCSRNCKSVPLQGCSVTCINATQYSKTSLFDFGSPLLNGVRPFQSPAPLPSQQPPVSTTIIQSSPADSGLLVVAVSVSSSVLVLAIAVIAASFIYSNRKKKRLLMQARSGLTASFSGGSADSSRRGQTSSGNSEAEISAKALARARKQYKNALKEAKKQQEKALKEQKRQISNMSLSGNTPSSYSTNNPLNSKSSQPEMQHGSHSTTLTVLEFAMESDPDLARKQSDSQSNTTRSNPNHQRTNSGASNYFYQNAINSALQSATASAQAAAMAANAAAKVALAATNLLDKQQQQPQNQNQQASSSSKKSLEYNTKEYVSTEVSNVIVPAPHFDSPETARVGWGTPDSQYGILANSSPTTNFSTLPTSSNSAYPQGSPSALVNMLNSIPPIVLEKETYKTSTIMHPGGTIEKNESRSRTVGYNPNTPLLSGNAGSSIPLIGNTKSLTSNSNGKKPLQIRNGSASSESSGEETIWGVCVMAHTAQHSHEIDMNVGDQVKIISGDGIWTFGVNMMSGSEGAFPSECVVIRQ